MGILNYLHLFLCDFHVVETRIDMSLVTVRLISEHGCTSSSYMKIITSYMKFRLKHSTENLVACCCNIQNRSETQKETRM